MVGRPDLSFQAQREALAKAASVAAVDSSYGQAMQSAQGLLGRAAAMAPRASAPGSGVTLEALQKLYDSRNSDIDSKINSVQSQMDGNGQPVDYSKMAPKEEIGRLIVETAQELGADPVDLATAISYETAGTFNPTQKGPVTQWGQHQGLIQFGEPQAAEYGVDWNDPLYSQLGAGKAVSKYFKSRGWQSGMSGLDLYSIINAGSPGKYNASDANNGGAPGTVRDKWEQQMGGHRQKAMAILGL